MALHLFLNVDCVLVVTGVGVLASPSARELMMSEAPGISEPRDEDSIVPNRPTDPLNPTSAAEVAGRTIGSNCQLLCFEMVI